VPVAPTQSRRAIVIGLAAVVAAVGLFFLVVTVSSTRNEIHFGSDKFSPGSADTVAERIAKDRRPDCYNDVTTGDRPVCVWHTGDDPEDGWVAVVAQVEGCPIQWDLDAQDYVDECTDRHYPPTGDGLVQLPVNVDDEGNLIVEINPDATSTTASTP